MNNHAKRTLEETVITGNDVFERVSTCIGMDAMASRKLVADVLKPIGSAPLRCTIEEVGALLPEIERRVRLLVRDEIADHAVRRLRRLLLTWDQ
jgi:hypothetical protein